MRLVFKIIKWIVISFFVSSFVAVIYYKWKPVQYTPLMFIRYMQNIKEGNLPTIEHEWVDLDKMSMYMPIAVIASEDQNFQEHNGFDFVAIEQAVQERKDGRRNRGASTISQQTAKNIFLWPTSSWIRKGFEVYFTVLIELCWSKERIMEVYLNSIEMGPNLYGVQAVAEKHFGCNASDLTRSNCALIAATLPNPIKYSSLRPSGYMRKRQRQIQMQMKHIPIFGSSPAKR